MKRIIDIDLAVVFDEDPDPSYLEQPEFADRLAAYRRNEFVFIGVRAVAEIEINGIRQTISSGGLWGIESDSDEAYLQSIYEEERAMLSDMLGELGFTLDEIAEESPTIEDYQREAGEPRGG